MYFLKWKWTKIKNESLDLKESIWAYKKLAHLINSGMWEIRVDDEWVSFRWW